MRRSVMSEKHSKDEKSAPSSLLSALGAHRAVLAALAVFALVFLVALGSSRSFAHLHEQHDLAHVRNVSSSLIVLIVGFAVIPATVFVLWQFLRQFRNEDDDPGEKLRGTTKRVLTQLLVVFAIGTAALTLAAAGRETRVRGRQPGDAYRNLPKPPKGAAHDIQQTGSALAPWIASAVAFVLVLLIATALLQRRRRARWLSELSPLAGELALQRDLSELVESSLEEIENEPDPRKAVIRAYSGMEHTFARHGFGRREFEAPLEYLERALKAANLSGRAGERLTRLFERARFSEHAIGPEMKSEAIAALTEIKNELAAVGA